MLDGSDEVLCQALSLEQDLSSEGPGNLMHSQDRSFPCELSEIVTIKDSREVAFIRPRGRGYVADPFNPVGIIMLALLIPINIAYLGFQGLRYLLTTRTVVKPLYRGTVQLAPDGLEYTPLNEIRHLLRYQSISSLGYYANGLRVNHATAKLVINSQLAPVLFVALTHLAPAAQIASGLTVPGDFPSRCHEAGRSIDAGRMRRNPPASWKPVDINFKLPISAGRIAAYVIIALLILIALPILFGK
jgi:hypothetical protein